MPISGTRLRLILWKTHDTLRQHAVRHMEFRGLCLSDFGILEYLLHKGPAPVQPIGSAIGLTSGSVTTAVERRCHRCDRRARMAHLTAAGRRLAGLAFAHHETAMERAASGLSRRSG